MDCLGFQSLIGIYIDIFAGKLTAISTDLFVSIPDRDLNSLRLVNKVLLIKDATRG